MLITIYLENILANAEVGRLLFRPCRTADTEKLEFEAIQVPKGMCIVFRGDWPHAGDSYPRRHDRMHFYLDAKYQITNKRETNTMYVHPTLNRLYHHKAYKYNLEAHTLYGVRQKGNLALCMVIKFLLMMQLPTMLK